MNIQDEVMKIHSQYGTSEMANYKIQLLTEQYAKEYHEKKIKKTLGNTTANQATKNVKDIIFWGNGDIFKLISKASSNVKGWMKSTKAMQIDKHGCIVQVTTQQGDNVAEAVTFVPGVKIKEILENNKVISRELVVI
jgi:hypothetical protein